MLTSKQAIRLQISKPEAGGGCEVGRNSAASQGKRSSERKRGAGLCPSKPLFTAHGNEQLFHISYVHSLWNVSNCPQASSERVLNLLSKMYHARMHERALSASHLPLEQLGPPIPVRKTKTTVPFSVWSPSEWTKGPTQPWSLTVTKHPFKMWTGAGDEGL